MTIIRSILLFVVAALAEIGGAWLVWQGVREHRGLLWISAGVAALGAYGFVATFQPDPNFGRILAAYGGIFVAGSGLGHDRRQISAGPVRHHRSRHLPARRNRHRAGSSIDRPPILRLLANFATAAVGMLHRLVREPILTPFAPPGRPQSLCCSCGVAIVDDLGAA